MENKHNFMETESITKLLIKFSIPAIVGMFVNALYNVVDRIYIGNIKDIGHLGITGIGVVFPVVILIFAFSLLIGIGSAAAVSLKLGMKDREEAERFLGVAVFLSFIISAVLMVIIYFNMDRIIYFIGGSKETFSYAKNYLFYINLGVPAAILGLVLNSVIRSDGSPKIAMGTLLIGAITNIVLDPIFIFMFGMGVKGAAIATIISQYVSMIWTIHYFMSKRSKIKLIKKDINVLKDKVPVVPAQHYTMGGIKVDMNSKTSMKNLYAIGEVACTGVHGKNRLASNSLLESVVFGKRAAYSIIDENNISVYNEIKDDIFENIADKIIVIDEKENKNIIEKRIKEDEFEKNR